MSQNDLTIANQGFASFRSDLNSALQALGSTNSGTSAPSTTFANQLFYDTANNILKIRNEDNDAFISLFTLDQTNDLISGFTSPITITLADNSTQLQLISTDADANTAPVLDLFRNSGSPADNDALGRLLFSADNDAGEVEEFGYIQAFANEVSNGSEDGTLFFFTKTAGADVDRFNIAPTESVFNDGSVDVDFRVESNGQANMLFVDGGNNRVGINTGSPASGYMLHVGGSSGVHTKVKIEATTATGQAELDLSADTAGVSYLNLGDEDAYNIGRIGYFHSDNSMRFNTNSSERLRIDNAGNIYSNVTVNPVSQSGTTTTGQILLANSYVAFGRVGGITAYFNRQHSDGDVIAIRQDGSDEGTISVSGTTVSYNAFSGSHWSRLTDNSKPTILKGTVIETIDEMCDWYQAKFTIPATTSKDDDGNEIQDTPEQTIKDSIALPSGKKVGDTISHTYEGVTYDNAVIIKEGDNKHPKCKISDTADSKIIYGVHADWDNDDDTVNDMYVTAVGTHVVRINKDVTVSAGDLLSSNGDGTAKVQDDDIIRSKTIGKVLTNIKQETYSDGSYTVPCALYCG